MTIIELSAKGSSPEYLPIPWLHLHPELLALLENQSLGVHGILDLLLMEPLVGIDAGTVEGGHDETPPARFVEDGIPALLDDELVDVLVAQGQLRSPSLRHPSC